MNLLDALKNVDKSPANGNDFLEQDVAQELDVHYFLNVETSRLRRYFLKRWWCSDTVVGAWAVYFDDEPVAYVTKSARKNDCCYKWVSQEACEEVRRYLWSLCDTFNQPDFIGLDDEIDDYYYVSYTDQLMDDVVYDRVWAESGEYVYDPVLIVDKTVDKGTPEEFFSSRVKICRNLTRYETQPKEEIVSVDDLYIPLRLQEEIEYTRVEK